MSTGIRIVYWAIPAIREHIKPGEALSRATVGIRIQETLNYGVVISALQIVEPGFGIAVVAPVAQRIDVCDGAGLGEHVAPGVVGILGVDRAALVVELDHVTLCVEDVMEGIVAGERGIIVTPHGEGSAALVIEEVQAADKGAGIGVRHIVPDNPPILGHVLMLQALGDLGAPHTGHVVFVGIGLIALFQAAQSPALRPGEVGVCRAVIPVLRIQCISAVADGYRISVVDFHRSQLVRPCGISIGVADLIGLRPVDLGGNLPQVACRVSTIRNNSCGFSSPVVGITGLCQELVHPVVSIFRNNPIRAAVGFLNLCDIAVGIVGIAIADDRLIARTLDGVGAQSGGRAG